MSTCKIRPHRGRLVTELEAEQMHDLPIPLNLSGAVTQASRGHTSAVEGKTERHPLELLCLWRGKSERGIQFFFFYHIQL